MALESSDYVMLGVSLAAAILGIFGGFSGALAFLAGVCAAVGALRFGWDFLAERIMTTWLLVAAALVVALIAFGVVRLIVKKSVKNLLAQPADAIFGALTEAMAAFAAALAAAYALETVLEIPVGSRLLQEALSFVR